MIAGALPGSIVAVKQTSPVKKVKAVAFCLQSYAMCGKMFAR